MNQYQARWWEQAKSDHAVFLLLRRHGAAQCHQLHFLQMLTEKLAKAYFWRRGSSPPKKHAGFVQFLRFLGHVTPCHRERIANLFSFARFDDLQNWMNAALPIAYELERLAPALANDGPNPEYPWPHDQPATAPASHEFAIWPRLTGGRGRDLMRVVQIAIDHFPKYADV
jgi:hypothetical protein